MEKFLSIVVPVYNEEKNLPILYGQLIAVIPHDLQRYRYEIIFVNDGSKDRSDHVIESLMAADPAVRYIEFSRNFGKEAATSAGLAATRGDAAIMIDADLQHPPQLLAKFLERWEAGGEVVVGIRQSNKGEGIIKKFGSQLFYKLMNRIADTEMTPNATDYRLLDRVVIDAFNRLPEKNRLTRGLIDWLGFKREYIYFHAPERLNGKAGYSFGKLVRLAFSSMVSLSLFPLRLAGYLGMIITVVAGAVGLFIFVEKYFLHDPLALNFSGAASLAVLVVFLVGIVLICLGFIALYIANIHREVIDRPMYVVRRTRKTE